jgi:hypothetical protein
MSGEVLLTSLGATLALFGVVLVWYLLVPNLVDALGTSAASASSAQESPLRRVGRYLFRLALDGDVPGPGFARAQRISAFVFTRIPAFVLGLGAYEGWLVMPSYPLGSDPLDLALRWVSAGLALWR